LHAHDRDESVGQDPADRGIGLELFEATHSDWSTPVRRLCAERRRAVSLGGGSRERANPRWLPSPSKRRGYPAGTSFYTRRDHAEPCTEASEGDETARHPSAGTRTKQEATSAKARSAPRASALEWPQESPTGLLAVASGHPNLGATQVVPPGTVAMPCADQMAVEGTLQQNSHDARPEVGCQVRSTSAPAMCEKEVPWR